MPASNIMHVVLHVQCLMFCSIVTKSGISRQIFVKDHKIKFHTDSTSGNRADLSSRTDGRTDGYEEINRRFSRLCRSI